MIVDDELIVVEHEPRADRPGEVAQDLSRDDARLVGRCSRGLEGDLDTLRVEASDLGHSRRQIPSKDGMSPLAAVTEPIPTDPLDPLTGERRLP